MKFNSLTIKLLSAIALAFVVTTVSVLCMADRQLTRIIDESQNALYKEKVESIVSFLARSNDRLEKTGLKEAYIKDFQEASIKSLRSIYYRQGGEQKIYPVIFTADGVVVMHPVLEAGDLSLTRDPGLMALLQNTHSPAGADYTYQGVVKWCWLGDFPEWDWVVGYAVPLDIKYKDAKEFRAFLVYIMGGVALLVLLCLSLVVARCLKPISLLTEAATRMAGGDLGQPIDASGSGEVGGLARSFNHMRNSIREKIQELETENRQRREAEVALAAEKERLSVTLQSIGDGVITTDVSGHVIFVNNAAEEILGWANDEALGQPLEVVFQPAVEEGGDASFFSVYDVVVNGKTQEFRERLLFTRDRRELIVNGSGAPIFDIRRQTVGLVLVFRDMTEQVKMEMELLKVSKLKSVGVLAGGIAHDFNNILAAILGNINLSLIDTSVKGKTRDFLASAEKACLRAKDLTLQLLTFSKGGEPIKELSSLGEVIEDSAKFVLHGDKVACHFDIAEDLWLVEIDKGQISQVIQNIVINGGVAMPEGGVITITAENFHSGPSPELPLKENERYVKIVIKDEGIGMSSLILEKVFEPYFSTKETGNGLGLAICHSIIAKHDGHITVDSTVGEGSVFCLYLPATEGEVVHSSEAVDFKKSLSSARVLVMDDEEMLRKVAGQMLVALGHKVSVAENGEEAISCYRQALKCGERFDLVIMDLTIPGGMGGLDAVQEILRLDPEARVVVSSGYSNDPAMANFKDYGFAAAMVKPFRLKDLSRVLAELT